MTRIETTTIAHIGIGSNLGNRAATLLAARNAIHARADVRVLRVSSIVETPAVGMGDDAPDFYNAVLEVECSLEHLALMQALLEIEQSLGRVRNADGTRTSRTLDLDLLLIGDAISTDEWLTIPHPRMMQRRFVLQPLAELIPTQVIPGAGCTVNEALARVLDQPVNAVVPYPADA